MFGAERLKATLNENPEEEPKRLIGRVHEAVDRFAGGAEQFDDITMLCFRYLGPGENAGQARRRCAVDRAGVGGAVADTARAGYRRFSLFRS